MLRPLPLQVWFGEDTSCLGTSTPGVGIPPTADVIVFGRGSSGVDPEQRLLGDAVIRAFGGPFDGPWSPTPSFYRLSRYPLQHQAQIRLKLRPFWTLFWDGRGMEGPTF